jgi:CRP-like cAMP-binding protein
MSDTEIETTIRRLLLYKKNPNSKESQSHITDIENQLIKICKKFHFFIKKVLTNKNTHAEKLMYDIINNLEFINVKESDIIWNVGDRINEMYIIFLGEVNIYKQPSKKNIEEHILECTLENGYSLGEEFLKNNVLRRTYIAEAKTFCILGKLSSKEYHRIFNKILYDENILIVNFLKDLNMFTTDYIDRFQRCLSLKYYNKNEYIFKQNQPFNTFYFIFAGRVRLTASLKKFVKSKVDHDILLGKNNNQRFTTSRLFEIRGFYTESINYNIVDLTYSDIIGGIEYINHFNNYRYSVKCLTDVEVLKVDLVYFNEILMNEEMTLFNKKLERQTEFISRRIKEIKEEREKVQLKDYITSKNKFTKTFLWNKPV